jgi:predicted ATP-dependent serine protease
LFFGHAPKHLPSLERTLRVRFKDGNGHPCKDANDAVTGKCDPQNPCYIGATVEDIRQAFADAEDPDLVTSERATANVTGRFVKSPWDSLNRVLGGGFLSGEVTHLAGAPKSGKTKLVLDLTSDLAGRGIKTGFVALDQDTSKIRIRFGMELLGMPDAHFYSSDGEDRESLIVRMDQAIAEAHKGNVLMTREQRITTYKSAISAVERMARAGAKLITVEDFLSLSAMLEGETKGKTIYAGRKIVTDLASVAQRCKAHVILINHLKVSEKGTQAYGDAQIGATAQVNMHVSARRDGMGKTTATVMHVRENRLGSTADVDIPFMMGENRRLWAGPPTKHGKKDDEKETKDWNGAVDQAMGEKPRRRPDPDV